MKKLLGIIGLSVALLNGCGDTEEPNPNQNTNQNENNNPSNEETNTDQNQNNCPTGFTGKDCSMCLPGYYGLNCKPCTCVHGECNDTTTGDGFCRDETCDTGWTGKNCNQCSDGYSGSDCKKISCVNGILNTEDGTCSTCNEGWAGENCDKCTDGYTGSDCVKITCIYGTLDTEDGTCSSCNEGWAGENCDQCADSRFTGPNCKQCAEGYFGENCDCKDNNTYKTVVINNLTWMAENLKNDCIDHYSADGKSSNDDQYGYLYTWENAQKACPTGWRLPTKAEFDKLISSNSASSLRDSSWSSGSNKSGFSALPAGLRSSNGNFNYFDSSAYYWSSTSVGSNAYAMEVGSAASVDAQGVNLAFSVRCIRK